MRSAIGLVVISVLLFSGCQRVGPAAPKAGTYPAACADLGFSARRCAAIVARAHDEAPLGSGRAGSLDILPPAPDVSGRLGGVMVAEVRFNFGDGSSLTQEVWCKAVGSADDLACRQDPQIILSGGVDHDVPCAGEAGNGDPAGCATLPPTPPAAAVAAAKPLRVETLDIPIDHLGQYEINVGAAGLPDGYLTKRAFAIADTRPTGFWIRGGIRLDVRSTVAGRPPVGSIYRDAFKGTEPVDVFLVFEVSEMSPGGVLQVRDLVVQ